MSMKVGRVIKQEVEIPGLGEKIKKARKDSQQSMRELTEVVGISPAYWYKLESEKVDKLAEETLRKIEEVLGVDFGVDFD